MPAIKVKGHLLDVSKVGYKKIEVNDLGGKHIPMIYNGEQLEVEFRNVMCPYGVGDFKDNGKYSMQISLGGSENLQKVVGILEELDDVNIRTSSENSKAWLNKKMTAEIIKAADTYKSMVKIGEKGDKPPGLSIKLKAYYNNGAPQFKLFGKDKKPIDIFTPSGNTRVDKDGKEVEAPGEIDWSWATNNMKVNVIAICDGLWIVGGKIYCSWKAKAIRIVEDGNSDSYEFDDSDEEEEEDTKMEDGDEEEEGEEEDGDEEEDDEESYESE